MSFTNKAKHQIFHHYMIYFSNPFMDEKQKGGRRFSQIAANEWEINVL